MSNGHYMAEVDFEGEWMRCDDESVYRQQGRWIEVVEMHISSSIGKSRSKSRKVLPDVRTHKW